MSNKSCAHFFNPGPNPKRRHQCIFSKCMKWGISQSFGFDSGLGNGRLNFELSTGRRSTLCYQILKLYFLDVGKVRLIRGEGHER